MNCECFSISASSYTLFLWVITIMPWWGEVKESFLPVFKDKCCDQGCDNHNERHSDCDYLVNCQTCKERKKHKRDKSYTHLWRKWTFYFLLLLRGRLSQQIAMEYTGRYFPFSVLYKSTTVDKALRAARWKSAHTEHYVTPENFASPSVLMMLSPTAIHNLRVTWIIPLQYSQG